MIAIGFANRIIGSDPVGYPLKQRDDEEIGSVSSLLVADDL